MFAQTTAAAVRSRHARARPDRVARGSAQAQQPSAAAISMAKELIALKGAATMYDPVVRGVVEQAKNVLLRTNPMLSKELNEVTAKLHAEYAPEGQGTARRSWRASMPPASPSRSSRTRSPFTRRRSARS